MSSESAYALLAIVAVPLLWWMIVRLSAFISGWRAVAEAYPAPEDFTGASISMQSAGFEGAGFFPANYSGVLTVGANERGVRFSIFILFRAGHAPIFAPYEDIRGEEGSLFFIPYVRLHLARTPETTIRIRRRLARWIEDRSGGAWSYERFPGAS
ncbi:MAG: hypothetical protein KAH44_23960 [Oricola sp.]|jgi:hypothetical protein|nr:hypothetical protein [Oricola sp.]